MRNEIRKIVTVMGLGLLLHSLPSVRTRAEDRVDYKYEDYSEEKGRIQIRTHSLLFEKDLIPDVTLQGALVYDGISGATPTGAPPIPGEDEVATTEIYDIRRAGFVAANIRRGRHAFAPQLAYSEEVDYTSFGLSLQDSLDFNEKNTTLTLGVSHDFDRIIPNAGTLLRVKEEKDNSQLLVGVTQLLGPRTVLTANLTLGYTSGYMADPYKGVLFDDHYSPSSEELEFIGQFMSAQDVDAMFAYTPGDPYALFPENRPRHKRRQVGLLSLTHHVDELRGSAEVAYRYYHDSFDIDAHTLSLAWRQRIGELVILSPSLRYYTQSAASFYGARFDTGSPQQHPKRTPAHYSSDFRLSDLDSLTYGVHAVWEVSERCHLDAAWKRYEMDGNDGRTSPSAYPEADIFSVGIRVWF
jgi:hypothetical protein